MNGIATSPLLQQELNNGFRIVLGWLFTRSSSQCKAEQWLQAIDIRPQSDCNRSRDVLWNANGISYIIHC